MRLVFTAQGPPQSKYLFQGVQVCFVVLLTQNGGVLVGLQVAVSYPHCRDSASNYYVNCHHELSSLQGLRVQLLRRSPSRADQCTWITLDASYLTNGYLETTIDWIPGMENVRFKDLPSFVRTTDPNDPMVNFVIAETERALRASAIIINTFEAFEKPVLDSLSSFLPPIYTLGPLHLMVNQVSDERLRSMHSNLWKEESECIDWLDSKKPNSVLYVNFGSITVMTPKQLEEFAWGLANSGYDFLWIVRPDLVVGESAMLPPEFVTETEGRGMLASWCSQEQILKHAAIAGFLTHSGWNSTVESVCGGVPMICWPFFAEQQTNCWFSCGEWGIGMEIDSDVRREEVERQVRELMEGEKGKEMKRKAVEWKEKAEEAAGPGGSSYVNLDKLITEVLLSK